MEKNRILSNNVRDKRSREAIWEISVGNFLLSLIRRPEHNIMERELARRGKISERNFELQNGTALN